MLEVTAGKAFLIAYNRQRVYVAVSFRRVLNGTYQWVDISLVPRSSSAGGYAVDIRFVQAENGCMRATTTDIKVMIGGWM